MLFTSANVEDIRRYYMGTFVKFSETGDTLYYLKSVDRFRIEGVAENGDMLRLYLDNEHPYNVSYVLPHKSYYQYGEYAAQLFRIPAKQYQRGIHGENTRIQFLKRGSFGGLDISFATLRPFVTKQKFYTLSEAITAEDKTSCVINPRMAYDRFTNSLYIDTVPVADVDPDTRVVKMTKAIFKDEVQEAVSFDNWKVVAR